MKGLTSHPGGRIEHWQALLDTSGEGIWGLDLKGTCTFINRRATDIFGFETEELMGCNMHDLIHHHRPDGSVFPGSECPVHHALHNNKSFRRMLDTMFRKDGSFFAAEVSVEPVIIGERVAGAVVIFREMTDVDRLKEDLREARELDELREAELRAVIENIPHAIYLKGPDAKVRSNHVAKMISGDRFPEQLNTLNSASAGKFTTETVRSNGRWVRSVGAPVMLHNKVFGGVAVNTDITQIRLQEEALRKSEKLAAVGQLASSIAHEINNPLESITNLLYLIRQSESMDDVQQYANLAQEELARVTRITLQTLRFHRQYSKPGEVDLAEMLRTMMSLYTGRMLVRGISSDLRLVVTPCVMALEGELRQVVNNLIRNSLDAMNTGGQLSVRLHPQSDPHTGARGVRFTVADTGEGISPDMASRLFEPFQTTKEHSGTGLGLWVSKGIIDKHGGRITNRTRRGKVHGTVFAVWLPVEGAMTAAQED